MSEQATDWTPGKGKRRQLVDGKLLCKRCGSWKVPEQFTRSNRASTGRDLQPLRERILRQLPHGSNLLNEVHITESAAAVSLAQPNQLIAIRWLHGSESLTGSETMVSANTFRGRDTGLMDRQVIGGWWIGSVAT
jgi:hypothetical protein